jgi:hypothetical protein
MALPFSNVQTYSMKVAMRSAFRLRRGGPFGSERSFVSQWRMSTISVMGLDAGLTRRHSGQLQPPAPARTPDPCDVQLGLPDDLPGPRQVAVDGSFLAGGGVVEGRTPTDAREVARRTGATSPRAPLQTSRSPLQPPPLCQARPAPARWRSGARRRSKPKPGFATSSALLKTTPRLPPGGACPPGAKVILRKKRSASTRSRPNWPSPLGRCTTVHLLVALLPECER